MRKTSTRDVTNYCFYCLLDDEDQHKVLDELPALKNKVEFTETIKWQALGYLNRGVDDPQAGKETSILLYNTYQVNIARGSKDGKEATIAATAVEQEIESNATPNVNAATTEADRILEAEWDKVDQSDLELHDEDWTMV